MNRPSFHKHCIWPRWCDLISSTHIWPNSVIWSHNKNVFVQKFFHLCAHGWWIPFQRSHWKLYKMFSSRWHLCGWTSPCAVPQSFSVALWNGSSTSDWRWPSFQERLYSTFHTPHFQVMDGTMSLASCPQLPSQALKCFRSSERRKTLDGVAFPRKALDGVALPISPSAQSFSFTLACPKRYTHGSFRRCMLNIDTWQCGLPIFFFLSSSVMVLYIHRNRIVY